MNKKEFTVRDIANFAVEKFKIIDFEINKSEIEIEADKNMINTIIKKIRTTIKKQNIESVGEGKTEQKGGNKKARNNAATYSIKSRDVIIYECMFDYLKNLSFEEKIRTSTSQNVYQKKARDINGEIEDGDLEILNMSDQERKEYEQKLAHGRQKAFDKLTRNSKEVQKKKFEIMLEALFNLNYSLNLDELVEDMFEAELIEVFKIPEAEVTAKDMQLLEKLENWENYVEMKKSTD